VTWQPDAKLSHLHVPVLATSLWGRLMELANDPVSQAVIDGKRVVQVCGCFRVHVADDGTLSTEIWRERRDEMIWFGIPDRETVLAAMPAGHSWLRLLRNAALVELRRHLRQVDVEFTETDLAAYGDALFNHFTRKLHRKADLRAMRRMVADALALDVDVLRVARRLMEELPDLGGVTVENYNQVMRHPMEFRLLERELPQAIPLYAALRGDHDFPDVEQPAQALKQHLHRLGFGASHWRRIARASTRLFLPVRDFYEGRGRDAMLDYLDILGTLKLQGEPPRWLVWEIFTQFANPDRRFPEHVGEVIPHARPWAHALRVLGLLDDPKSHREDLGRVLTWLRGEHAALDKLRRRAGWGWLVREAGRSAERRHQAARCANTNWFVPFEEEVCGGYLMRAISTPLALWEEGHAMRHCAGDYPNRCADGVVLMVSVRRQGQPDRRVATVMLEPSGGSWRAAQVRGPANRDPERGVAEAVQQLISRLDARRPKIMFLDRAVSIGQPAAGDAPANMPPNARLIAECSWYWSPNNDCRLRYLICSNRQRTLWLLWERPYDSNWSRWLPASVVAHAPRKAGDNERLIACRLLEELWRAEIHHEALDPFSEGSPGELLLGDELDHLSAVLWPVVPRS
jgi:hypothetical protein